MIIEGEIFTDVLARKETQSSFRLDQGMDFVVIDKHQAAQLIEVLQRWVDDEEIE